MKQLKFHKIRDYLRFGWQLVTKWRVQHEEWIAKIRDADLADCLGGKKSVKTLDLANGQLRPQYQILRAQGRPVYGIDKINLPTRNWQHLAYVIARFLYARRIQPRGLAPNSTLVCGDVSKLPFFNESFDLVTSVAAFEHFLDVPAAFNELHRVVRSGGLIWIFVHLFSSPSGGHNISLSEVPLRKIPRGIDAWDHLRQRRLPFHVPLNEWRRDQYLRECRKHFDIVKHYCAMREGEHLLTRAIEGELAEYTRDELTCAAYVIVGRKLS